MRPARQLRAAPYRHLSTTGQTAENQLCLWPATGACCYPRRQAEPEPDEVVEGDEGRRSQQEPGNEDEPTQLNSRNPSPGAMREGPGAAAPVSSAEAAEFLARLEEEFPADRDEDSDA